MRNFETGAQRVRHESWVTSKYPYHNSHVWDKEKNERKVSRDLALVESLVEINDPKERLKEFALHMQKPMASGVVVANHDQHINVSGFLKTVKSINSFSERPLIHHLVVTQSLVNGDQGLELQRFALGMIPALSLQGMDMVPIMRDKDRAEFYGEGKKTQEDLAGDNKLSLRNAGGLMRGLEKGEIVWIFPAGTTSEGVVDPKTGIAPGMDHIKIKTLAFFVNRLKSRGNNLKFLSLSLNGFNQIVPAREKAATHEARKTIIKNKLLGRIFGNKYIAEVIPGVPYGVEEMEADGVNLKKHEEVNDYVLGRIAENVAPERRGVFK